MKDLLLEVLDTLEQGISIVDSKGNILFINKAAEKIYHKKNEDVVNKNACNVVSFLSNGSIFLDVISSGKPVINKIQKHKGQEIYIKSIYPIKVNEETIGAYEVIEAFNHVEKLFTEACKFKEISCDEVKESKGKYSFDLIIGKSNKIIASKKIGKNASKTLSPVLIYGETGTGKELFVKAIHYNSVVKDGPLIAENCAAIPKTLLEGILFGTVKGSFTGASNNKGLFELADGGTLYLDELNSMPVEIQAKLLRVIQEGTFIPIGSASEVKVKVRIIASVNEDPLKLIAEGKLRSDLFYRLNVVRINLPPLRERKEDIQYFVEHFIGFYNKKFNGKIAGIENEAIKYLLSLSYEGNVRELQHIIEAVFNEKSIGLISLEDIKGVTSDKLQKHIIPLKDKLKSVEIESIKEALLISEGNVSEAAKILEVPRQTLQSKMKKYNLG